LIVGPARSAATTGADAAILSPDDVGAELTVERESDASSDPARQTAQRAPSAGTGRAASGAANAADERVDPIELRVESHEYDDRDDTTAGDLRTAKFERGDPTQSTVPGAPSADATEIQAPRRSKQLTSGTLRRASALRRKRGLYGDVRYVFTALLGVRRSRRELAESERRQELRATSRRRHLVTLGRSAATMDLFAHPALGKARDRLAEVEDERAKHTGAVAASDAELERVRREREATSKAHAETVAKAAAELAEVAKKLEPLEREAAQARKRASELRDELQRIDRKIAEAEALVVSVKGEKMDKAALAADIATLRANKQAVLRDEPAIAAQLDALEPRIAALDAQRAELQRAKSDAEKAEADDHKRSLELLDAIGAKRKVVERAAADAEAARDHALFELGERLYVDRPSQLTAQLSPIDRIDLEIGEDERRAMELREILSNVDHWKLARGSAMIVLVVGVVAAIAYVVLTR